MGEQIAAVLMVLVVGDVHADLVEVRRPSQQQPVLRSLQPPRHRNLREQGQGRVPHPLGVGGIDVVAAHEVAHGGITNVLMMHPAEQVLEQPFAQGALADLQ